MFPFSLDPPPQEWSNTPSPFLKLRERAIEHTMRLDKIMIWISIHLHSLPRDTSSVVVPSSPLSAAPVFVSAKIPSTIPFHVSQSYARYHTNALVVPSALVSLLSKCDAAGWVSSTTRTSLLSGFCKHM